MAGKWQPRPSYLAKGTIWVNLMKMDPMQDCPTLLPTRSSLEARYKLRNLVTGEELDLRDENKAEFVLKLTHLVTSRTKALETY